MRIIVWNQSDRFILQLADDRAIDKDGKHSYDKYADSIEILAHIDYAKKQPAAVFLGHAGHPDKFLLRSNKNRDNDNVAANALGGTSRQLL